MKRASWLLGGAAAAAALASCTIYGPDLVGNGGSGGGSASSGSSATSSNTSTSSASSSASSTSSSSTSASSSGTPPCTDATDCPGVDTECRKRTCTAGKCGVDNTAMGTALAAQTAGDCKKSVCDGNGGTTSIDDDLDIPDDKNDCTTDDCSAGAATHTPLPSGTSCTAGGGKFCSAAGTCVECATGANCASNVCKNNICVAAGCNDGVQNGSETDVDCGGGTCPACGFNKKCGGDSDCAGHSCISAHCAATCNDTQKDGAETDVDCGGGTCPTCASGKACTANGDCQSGTCKGGVCADVLLISEIQTRGDAAGANGSDEFIEIYNPMSIPVVFDSMWAVWARGATSACSGLQQRFAGNGKTIPPHGHILFANSGGYNGAVAPDGTYTVGVTDAAQVVLLHDGALVDSVCFQYNAATLANLTCADPGAMMWFVCQGMGVSNLPHNNGTSQANNTDVSIERKPGGAAGNGQSTGDNTADFNTMVTPNPQNLMSPAVP